LSFSTVLLDCLSVLIRGLLELTNGILISLLDLLGGGSLGDLYLELFSKFLLDLAVSLVGELSKDDWVAVSYLLDEYTSRYYWHSVSLGSICSVPSLRGLGKIVDRGFLLYHCCGSLHAL